MRRREFLAAGAAGLFAGCRIWGEAPEGEHPLVRFGMVTDLHFAEIAPDSVSQGIVGWRYYRESRRKLAEAVAVFNRQHLDFAIELGDFKDNTNGPDGTLRCLDTIEATFAKFDGPRYHVVGNHDLDCITPTEFLSRTPNDGEVSSTGYYDFSVNGVTFIVLNATYRADGEMWSRQNRWDDANVPVRELYWLGERLASAEGPVYVFCHQRLDDAAAPGHLVRNAAQVRAVLEASGKVKGVFTGHQHMGGATVQGGIPYYSLRALVHGEGRGANSFAVVDVYPSGAFTVTGWRNAVSRGVRGEFPSAGLAALDGDSSDYPAGTCPAFRAAAARGAEMVACDVVTCKTGELIVTSQSRFAHLSLSEIRQLDVGRKKSFLFAGTRLPVLFEALAQLPRTGLYIVLRCRTLETAQAVAELLRRTDRLAQGVVALRDRHALMDFKGRFPDVKTALPLTMDVQDAASLGVDFVLPSAQVPLSCEQVAYLHERGIRTIGPVVNDATHLRALLAAGYDFPLTERWVDLRDAYATIRTERR